MFDVMFDVQDHQNHPQDHQNHSRDHQKHPNKEPPWGLFSGLVLEVIVVVLGVVLVVLELVLM